MLNPFPAFTKIVQTTAMENLRLLAFVGLIQLCCNAPANASPLYRSNPFSYSDPYGLSPFWNWKTIESENFFVTFPEELSDTANRATNYLEEAHSILSPLLRWQPNYKVQILIIDNKDSANGLTTPLAKFGIILWATPPDSNSSTNAYDDWLRLLIIHEYTHFLNMDTTYGIWKTLRPLFGAALLPNSAWPPWMLEGLAVFMETQFTQAGRGRSNYYEMVLRAAVQDKTLNTPEFITIDKVPGNNPYFPEGDTRYLFGYYLMNQVARSSTAGPTHDLDSTTEGGVDTLGIMSQRSGWRIPLFINGNLENISGKDWYQHWQDWVSETEIRQKKSLDIIHSEPTTQYELLTTPKHSVSNDAEGLAISDDGQWLAYNLQSADKRQGLFLRNLKTNKVRLIEDKLGGVGMNFTPAKGPNGNYALIYSELNQAGVYSALSDLKLYDLKTDSTIFLTHNLRARDPDVSRDGRWITFTLAEASSTYLARARFIKNESGYALGPIEKIYTPPKYDRVANPKFSDDGWKIYFTVHPNGKYQEDLMVYDLKASGPETLKALIADGNFNLFPAVNQKGDLYFISNSTGVNNLYKYVPNKNSSIQVTNVSTGIFLPTFNLNNNRSEVYASVFSSSGWDLALIKLFDEGFPQSKLKIPPPNLPNPGLYIRHLGEFKTYPVTDYYPLRTILPRAWTPVLEYSSNGGIGIGAEAFGFDATNQHRYLLGASYNTIINSADIFALYSNRTLGPTLSISGDILASGINTSGSLTSYQRQLDFSATLAYPLFWTYSAMTPSVSVNLQRLFAYQYSSNAPDTQLSASTPLYTSVDAVLSYSNQEKANLSVTSESGRFAQIGTRTYLLPEGPIWKGLLVDQEYIKLLDHTILSPSFKGLMVSNTSQTYASANSILTGRLPQIANSFVSNGLDHLSIRGYPNYQYLAKYALVTSLDLTVPLGRIFRGWGTNPFFLDNLYGFTFVEAGFAAGINSYIALPSIGGGLRLSAETLTIPLLFSWEYHQGLNIDQYGSPDFFFQVSGSLPF